MGAKALSKRRMSPRNLFKIKPATEAFSLASNKAMVPTKEAKAPPRSISAHKSTGALA